MAAKNGGQTIIGKGGGRLCVNPAHRKFCQKNSHTTSEINAFLHITFDIFDIFPSGTHGLQYL